MTDQDAPLQPTPSVPRLFFVTGETSGDLIGARLLRALRRRHGGELAIAGLGGEAMAAEGLDSLFDPSELSLFGIFELLPHLPRILRRRRQVIAAIAAFRPDAVIGIDASAFFRTVSKGLAKRGDPAARILYKAPQAWGYWAWRARPLARLYDAILAILPFEPAFFARYGAEARFIGHPATDAGIEDADGPAFRRTHAIPATAPLLAVLPGSRHGEVTRLLPVFREVVARVAGSRPELRVVLPTVTTVAETVRQLTYDWSVPVAIVTGEAARYAAFRAADAALAASGTVTTELAIAGTPMVVAYRVSAITGGLAHRISRVDHVSIVNLVLDHAVVPEFLQERCTPDLLVPALQDVLADGAPRRRQIAGLAEAVAMLRPPGGLSPSDAAADIVLDLTTRRGRAAAVPSRPASAG
ncbi:MAG: lipid-A-disaccharide synthase [Azospirillaceae bacterium]